MSKRDKLRRKLRNNPKAGTRKEIETLLGYYGFEIDRVTGSHYVFILKIKAVNQRLVIPIHGQSVKAIYVKQVIEKLDELFPIEDEEKDTNDD